MKDKRNLRKKNALNAKRFDENASVSSDLNSLEDHDNDYQEQEIHKKIQQRDDMFGEDDFDFMGGETEIKSIEDEPIEKISADNWDGNLLDQQFAKTLKKLEKKSGKFDKFYSTFRVLLLYYFSMKNDDKNCPKDHPVIKYILKCQEMLPIFERADVEKTGKEIPSKKEKTSKKAFKVEDETHKENALLITKEMFKNKGIPKRLSLKKKALIPKMKQKRRFQKAQHKMVSRGLGERRRDDVYQGERKGIKASLNRTIDI